MPTLSEMERRRYSSTSEEDSSDSETSVNRSPLYGSSNSSKTKVGSQHSMFSKSMVPKSTVSDHASSGCKNVDNPFAGAAEADLVQEAGQHIAPSVAPLEPAQAPDWHALLFGARDVPSCKEILKVPEYDTYAEDCKLAEDVSLNYVAGIDMPMCNILRDFNKTLLNRVLKNTATRFPDVKEEAVALVMLLDYVSCCCQNRSLLTLYDKSKDSTKEMHLDKICTELYHLVKGMTLDELRPIERIVTASIARLPSHLKVNHSFLTTCLKRSISVLKNEEKKKSICPVYAFNDDEDQVSPINKKQKLSTVPTSKNLLKEKMDSDTGLSMRKQTQSTSDQLKPKKKSNSGLRATKEKIQTGLSSFKPVQPSPEWGGCSPFTDYSLESDESILARWLSPSPTPSDEGKSSLKESKVTSTPEFKKKSYHDLSSSDEEYANSRSKRVKIQDQVSLKILTYKTSVSQFEKKPSSEEISFKSASLSKFSSFSSDDSLPDIPITVTVKKPISPTIESSVSESMAAKPKNEEVSNVRPTPKQKTLASSHDSLTKSSAKKKNTTILDFFRKMENHAGLGSSKISHNTQKLRSPLKSLQYDTSRNVDLLDININSQKLVSQKTPKSYQSQTLPISFNGKKMGAVPPRPGPLCTSSDSEASSDSLISESHAGTSGSSELPKPVVALHKNKINTWNSKF